jgi:integrase/recombinase XerD
MPSLTQQGNRWYLTFHDSQKRPKRKKIALRVEERSQAVKLKQQFVTAWMEGRFCPWTDDPRTFRKKEETPCTLDEAMSDFIDAKKEQGCTQNTIRSYEGNFRRLRRVTGERTLDTLSASLLNEYIRDESVSSTTQNKRHRHINALLNWCVKQELMPENPLDKETAPKRRERLPKTMYREDLEAICDEIRKDYREKREAGRCKKHELIWREWAFRWAFLLGFRGSELARLEWSHIDRKRGLVFIYRQKNGKEQTVPLHDAARDVLDEIPETEPDGSEAKYVFGSLGQRGPGRNIVAFRNNLSRSFREYRKVAGIERPISMHSLRHGFCTALAEAGKSAAVIKELARHSDISTSMIYVRMSAQHLKDEMRDVF